MYNEKENDFKYTMRGVMQNYNALVDDPQTKFKPEDFIVVVVIDGVENMPDLFKDYAKSKKMFDTDLLYEKGFMQKDK